ncbi:MAG: PhnD/SsuA/transferrin family substrate-binding protein [Neisseriaceae bacterium]|nr:PhnD/SsuA/transferrin family substrate-binding protein [Neisseriaceae bacterium]MBQ9723879.1 PhnD/SsuA/transferrin family substrate-binding protein [Neisseriaceae bacterium]
MPNLLIAPDFPPEHFGGWHIFNTTLQRDTDNNIHLLTPHSAEEQQQMLEQNQVDIIYASPFDAASLIRDKNFLPVVKPVKNPDEMVIAAGSASGLAKLTDLKKGMKIAITNNRDVKLIGLRLLEAANLTEADLEWVEVPSFQAAARHAIQGKADAAFFVASSFHSLSEMTKNQMAVLIESHITDITHVILMHPEQSEFLPTVRQSIINMKDTDAGRRVLSELNMPDGFEELTEEETEFMIDLMETLLD